jgi:CHAT domain-containing protein
MAARSLLYALATSLERNHQDSWLTRFLPPASFDSPSSESPSPDPQFPQAARALGQSIDAAVHGDYPGAAERGADAERLFHRLRNSPDAAHIGEARAVIERADALQAMANYAGCYQEVHALAGAETGLVWMQAEAEALDAYCDPSPGSDVENNPSFVSAETLAYDRHYAQVELRVRNMRGGAAVDGGDVEAAWHDYLGTIRQFYAGDYPALRLSGTLSSLEQVEQGTPRTKLALLLQREHIGALQLTQNRQLLPTAWLNLAAVAIRASSIDEAQQAMQTAQQELAANGGGTAVQATLAEVETALADVYLERGEPDAASKLLDSAFGHMAGEKNAVYLRNYAVARGQLALEQGHPEAAEPVLQQALLEQERLSSKGGPETIAQAQQNRDLYAVLVGIWLAGGRPGEEALALWQRYRLRILGVPVVPCADGGLDCLKSKLQSALERRGSGRLLGQVVLPDRVLLYKATPQGVVWFAVPVRREDVLNAAGQLEKAVDSPTTEMAAVDRAARRIGAILIDPIDPVDQAEADLLLEPDPLLGNLPWPSVETASGGLGLKANLEESPSLLLERAGSFGVDAAEKALVVGASVASGEGQMLPEVLAEARSVARFDIEPSLLLGDQATEAQVVPRLANAAAIHFAGHAASRGGTTRLLLAPGKGQDSPWLDSETLRRHPPRDARLAVFSACSSGRNQAAWNHGMGDIVSTLAAVGVPDVVATRWQIDSAAAVPMMDAFYGGLARGLTVPRALTVARQAMVRDPRYRHPYYWAAWYASGTGTADLSTIFRKAG